MKTQTGSFYLGQKSLKDVMFESFDLLQLILRVPNPGYHLSCFRQQGLEPTTQNPQREKDLQRGMSHFYCRAKES